MRLSTIIYGAVLAAANASAEKATLVARGVSGIPSAIPMAGSSTSQGCYKSQGNMTIQPDVKYMSSAGCNNVCKDAKYWVSGLHGPQCWCGFALPPKDDIVDDSNCNTPCPAWQQEACGSDDDFSVFNLGINLTPPRYDPASSTSKSSKSSPSSTATAGSSTGDGSTAVSPTNVPVESSKPDSDKKSGPNVAGIAAGVVVGVVAAGALIGGIFFYIRRKRNAEIEEEHRRNAAVNAFISGSKPPSSSGSVSMTDARLDPVMAHRRMSDGSIADNEDYSRRILRVSFDGASTKRIN